MGGGKDQKHPRVVDLPRTSANRPPVKLPAQVEQVAVLVAEKLQPRLSDCFAAFEEHLFAKADRADSNASQDAYIDLVREFRLVTDKIERGFRNSVRESFAGLRTEDKAEVDLTDPEQLSLVEDDELEEKVALKGIMGRLIKHNSAAYETLTRRMRILLASDSLDDHANPVGPASIAQAFLLASRDFDVPIRVRLQLLKIFEKQVLSEWPALVDQVNALLTQLGILPDNNPASRTVPRGGTRPQAVGATGAPAEPVARPQGSPVTTPLPDEKQLTSLFERLSRMAEKLEQGDAVPLASVGPAGASGAMAPVLAHDDLLQVLDRLQRVEQNLLVIRDSGMVDIPQTLTDSLRTQKGIEISEENGLMADHDEAALGMVNMLFEYLIEKSDMPRDIKDILSRLQIPVAKVAMIDPRIFTDDDHPVRDLLNEVARYAKGWSQTPGVSNRLRRKIDSLVSAIQSDFRQDIGVFHDAVDDFHVFIEEEKQRAALIEQRVREAEEGRARVEMARRSSQEVIATCIESGPVPSFVHEFLEGPWSQALSWCWLHDGDESESWKALRGVTQNLVLSCMPVHNQEDRDRLGSVVPVIREQIQVALNRLGADAAQSEAFLGRLARFHQSLLDATGPVEAEKAASAPSPKPNAKPEPAVSQPTLNYSEDGEWIEKIEALAPGQWVELEQGDRMLTCKLAAVVQSIGRYIFVGRNGAKVAEREKAGLVQALKEGRMRLVDEHGAEFDQTLASLIGNMRKRRDEDDDSTAS
jgi:hypothetical protein